MVRYKTGIAHTPWEADELMMQVRWLVRKAPIRFLCSSGKRDFIVSMPIMVFVTMSVCVTVSETRATHI